MSKFYVSYNFQDKLERKGFGSCQVNFNCDKITTDVMSKIYELLFKENDFKCVVIINVMRLEDE